MLPDQEKSVEIANDPFNHYNTEFVKLDANQWLDDVNDGTKMIHLEGLQFGLLTKSERQAELFAKLAPDSVNNKSFTDVTFIVGPPQHSKKYVGHRVLLAMTSPVFETLFYGDMADKNKYIRIPDVAPIGFENLLRFAYTDSLNLSSVEDAMLTAYAAKKYLLPQLLRECLTYIEQNMTTSSACVVFEFAQVLNSQQLVLQAIQTIDRQTQSVINKKSFILAQPSTVEFLANRKYLAIRSEYSLFCALLNWSVAEYRRRSVELVGPQLPDQEDIDQSEVDNLNQINPTGRPINWLQVRDIMMENNLLQACRFVAMSQHEFARCIARSSAITKTMTPSTDTKTSADNDIICGEKNNTGADDATNDPTKTPGDTSDSVISLAKGCVNTESANCLLAQAEQRAVFMNLAMAGSARMPATLNVSSECRQPAPDSFCLNRFSQPISSTTTDGDTCKSSQLIPTTTTMTSTRSIHGVYSKFQCLNENIFITAVTIPIRLDAASYISKTPKFECHLKFTTRPASLCVGGSRGSTTTTPSTNKEAGACLDAATATASANLFASMSETPTTGGALLNNRSSSSSPTSALLMDSLDESLHISISREKDCFVRLKRPILIRMGNINEILITFQNYALDEDVALRMPKQQLYQTNKQSSSSSSSKIQSEILDDENIRWLFYKPPSAVSASQLNVELSEIHYYY